MNGNDTLGTQPTELTQAQKEEKIAEIVRSLYVLIKAGAESNNPQFAKGVCFAAIVMAPEGQLKERVLEMLLRMDATEYALNTKFEAACMTVVSITEQEVMAAKERINAQTH